MYVHDYYRYMLPSLTFHSLQPLKYGFEAMMVNEFHTINAECSVLVPTGPGYENVSLANKVCTTVGSLPGQSTVNGERYLSLDFNYSYSHLWRVSTFE